MAECAFVPYVPGNRTHEGEHVSGTRSTDKGLAGQSAGRHTHRHARSIVAEVELFTASNAQRIFQESLAAMIAQVESHRSGRVVPQGIGVVEFLDVHPFKNVLDLLEMVDFAEIGIVAGSVVNCLEHLDFHYMTAFGAGIDGTFAKVTRVMKHERLRGKRRREIRKE